MGGGGGCVNQSIMAVLYFLHHTSSFCADPISVVGTLLESLPTLSVMRLMVGEIMTAVLPF